MNLQILLYLFLVVILFLSYGILYLVRKISKQNELLNKPQNDYVDTLELVQQAQKQANAIVERAVESAKHILFETEYVKHDITREMQDSLQKVAEETIKMVQGRSDESEKEFRAVVDEIKSDFVKEATEKLTAIEKVTEDETNDFREILRKETVGAQEYIGKKISQDFESVQAELAEYKKARLEEIEKNIQGILRQVILEAIGSNINLQIHEDLVLESLDKAKKTGFFKNLEEKNKVAVEEG
ncbi:MAG: hypothetical protein ACM3IJ_00895 [Candidatus Levyibacteriota bacterium]